MKKTISTILCFLLFFNSVIINICSAEVEKVLTFEDDFSGNTWKSFSNQNGVYENIKNASLKDASVISGKMYVAETGYTVSDFRNIVVPGDYSKLVSDEFVFETDYKKGTTGYDRINFLFNISDLYRTEWNVFASAYGCMFYSNEYGNFCYLVKYDGGNIYNEADYSSSGGIKYLNSETFVRKVNTDYRFRISVRKNGESKNIQVYYAEYSAGALGEYKKIIEYTDTTPIGAGYFGIYSAPKNGNMHIIDNVDYYTFKEKEKIKYIYVSPNGNDSGSGEIDSPLKTLDKARVLARNFKTEKTIIYLREGKYNFKNSVRFTADDARTGTAPLEITSYNGENAELCGSLELDTKNTINVPEAVYKRLPEISRDKVKAIDLKKCGLSSIEKIPDNLSSFYDVGVYCGDVPMSVASAPNGNEFDTFKFLNTQGKSFIYNDDRYDLWKNADDAYVQGFFEYDYTAGIYKIKNIDTENNIITMADGNVSKNFNTQSARFKVYNLLEELDIAGEWYIDRDNLILYYYPLNDELLEISVLNDYIIDIQNCSNVTLKNLEFSKSKKTALNVQNNSEKIVVDACFFHDISTNGLRLYGTTVSDLRFGEYDPNWAYLRYMYNGCRYSEVKNCIFTRIGSTALKLFGGGNPDYVECGENRITNNIFTNNSINHLTDPVVELNGIGDYFENNFINNQFGQAIFHSGAKNKIRYNEVENVLNGVQDAGAIYSGRSTISRGAEISYNLVTDTLPNDERISPHNRAIYYDDEISGQICHHNILVNGDKAITYGGSSGNIYANTMVNFNIGLDVAGYGYSWKDTQSKKYLIWQSSSASNKTVLSWDNYKAVRGSVPDSAYEAWNEEFPEILEEAKFAGGEAVESRNVMVYNNFSSNAPNQIAAYIPQRGGKNENNTAVTNYAGFVNAKNGDYRIRYGENILNSNSALVSEEFDMNTIGVDLESVNKNFLDASKSFYKKSVSITKDGKTAFSWTDSVGADNYILTVSKDSEFKDIIAQKKVYDNYAECSLSLSDNYYWKVSAVNESTLIGAVTEMNDTYEEKPVFEILNRVLKNSENCVINNIEDYRGKSIYLAENIVTNTAYENITYIFAVYEGGRLVSAETVVQKPVFGENKVYFKVPENFSEKAELSVIRVSNINNLKPIGTKVKF